MKSEVLYEVLKDYFEISLSLSNLNNVDSNHGSQQNKQILTFLLYIMMSQLLHISLQVLRTVNTLV